MDSFSIIQNFFTRMHCNFCSSPFEPEGIQLIREEDGFYIVSVSCCACERQIGVAMVGVEALGEEAAAAKNRRQYDDPELTPDELERFEQFAPVNYDDVLSAHEFFNQLDEGWMRFIPQEILERCTDSDKESPV
jgi:predicted HAD superfamily phosphohydrolase